MMDLLIKTKKLCQAYNIKPVRSRGQNFLINDDVYKKIIKAADLNKDDVVLEVGPGLGFLTEKLAGKVSKIVAVEVDRKLADVLRARLDSLRIKNVEIINSNILKISNIQYPIFNKITNNKFKVVANLPYNITSIFLRKFLSDEIKPELMVLMLQKEVADRIVACPPKMSLLAVSVQFYSSPEIIEYIDKENFWPMPAVNSAIVKIRGAGQGSVQNEKEIFQLVKFGFSAKRKMLKNNLAAGFRITQKEAEEKIKKAGFNSKIRAQELFLKDWIKIFNIFKCG